ncbi:MAG TPA: hypothetical protein P5346_06410 [Spirochaetota bacterium]|nr:hypothetical protein [Spirochaetota bacterium]
MANKSDSKKIERRAKSMLLDKDIPPAKMEIVRSLMRNTGILPEERYRAIIELVQSCPDRIARKPSNRRVSAGGAAQPQADQDTIEKTIDNRPDGPTETSYFINEIYHKYRHSKMFKKRYLVHKNNRIGIGFKKRLIPGKNLIKVLTELFELQEKIVSRLDPLLTDILNDPEIEDPLIFNYIRVLRRWLMDQPLVKYPYESLKWMEHHNFERELRPYIVSYYSFIRLDIATRESIILMVENKLRMSAELKKEDILQAETDPSRVAKEKRNLELEKKIYDYIMTLRSFMPNNPDEDNLVSKWLKNRYGIASLNALVHMLAEALIYQRPFADKEIHSYYFIASPKVSSELWDYSEDFLKKVGKDPESRRKKQADVVRKELEPYETRYVMLNLDDNGRDILLKAADEQLRLVDKKKYDLDTLYRDNFFGFLDALVNYFNNAFVPLLNGSTVEFTDTYRETVDGSVFSEIFFAEEMSSLTSILNEMHFFRSNNPTLALSHDEVKKIMKGQIQSMGHVKSFITMIGDFFYRVGRALQPLYEGHGTWVARGKHLPSRAAIRKPIQSRENGEQDEAGKPVPFYDCTIKEFRDARPLSQKLSGKRVLSDSLRDGVIAHLLAFAFQVSFECMNERVSRDMEERKKLLAKLKGLDKTASSR